MVAGFLRNCYNYCNMVYLPLSNSAAKLLIVPLESYIPIIDIVIIEYNIYCLMSLKALKGIR